MDPRFFSHNAASIFFIICPINQVNPTETVQALYVIWLLLWNLLTWQPWPESYKNSWFTSFIYSLTCCLGSGLPSTTFLIYWQPLAVLSLNLTSLRYLGSLPPLLWLWLCLGPKWQPWPGFYRKSCFRTCTWSLTCSLGSGLWSTFSLIFDSPYPCFWSTSYVFTVWAASHHCYDFDYVHASNCRTRQKAMENHVLELKHNHRLEAFVLGYSSPLSRLFGSPLPRF